MLTKLPLFSVAIVASLAASSGVEAQTLDSIARLAIRNNLTVQRTAERAREADYAVVQARGLFMPTVAIDARYSTVHGAVNIGDFINPAYAALNQLLGQSAFPTNIDATLPLNQETRLRTAMPVFYGALFANLAGARAIRDLRAAERGAALRRIDAESRIAYLNWGRAARAVEIWDVTLPVIEESARVSQCLVDAGSGTPDAVLRARAAVADARQQRAEAVRLRDAALGAFNVILDRDIESPAPALSDSTLPSPPSITMTDALAASARREEWSMAGAAVEGARAQGRAAASTFLPTVSVALDYGVQGNRYRFDRANDVLIGSVVMQWNLFNGGQDVARRDAARAAQRGAELHRSEIGRQIDLDVRTSWDAVQATREALEAATARLAAARSAFTLVDRRYAEGLTSYLEWSDARAQLTAASLNEVQTRYALAARGVDLERAAALRAINPN